MDYIIGFLLGLGAVPLYHRLKGAKKAADKPPLTEEQQRLLHEYRNFIHYTGDEQEEYRP